MKIKIPQTDLEITITKGNKKPIPAIVWIANMQSSTDCISRKLDMCEIGEDCYGLAFEENPIMYKTVECRRNDEEAMDYMVQNHMSTFFAEELVRRDKLSRSHHLKYLRWNATGDCKTLQHLLFADEVADILHEEIGATSTIYTHRKDLWEEFKDIRQSEWLIVNGSNFMADNNFTAVTEFNDENDTCSSNCVQCFNEGKYYCYNINRKGRVIEEKFRPRNKKKGDD